MKTAFTITLALLTACEGIIGDPGTAIVGPDGPEGPGPFGEPDNPVRPTCDGVCIGESGLVRITRDQYIAAVEASFETSIVLDADRLPADQSAGAFTSNAYSEITERDVAMLVDAAEQVAAQLVDVVDVDCDPADCGEALFLRYAPTLFRRPVQSVEADPYADLYAWAYPEDGQPGATELVLETMLQSPSFLYRPERAVDGTPTLLDGNAIASRLATFLWASVPDPALIDSAESGVLDTADGIESVTREMLRDPRAARGIGRFHREWLGIDEVPTDAALADAMRSETEAFAVRVFGSDEPTIRALLTESHAPIDDVLADHYGASSGEWVEVRGRSGILTQGSVMTAHGRANYTRAVHRGVFLRTEVLCQSLLDPPADALDDVEAGDPESLTDREQLALATSGGDCEACHRAINPAGFAFESYDELGRFRMQDDEDREIDASGVLVGAGDADGPFESAADLTLQLADSAIVGQCITRQWFRHALGRIETEDDDTTLFDAYQALAASDGNLRELIVALTRSDAFRFRRAPEAE